MEKETEDSLHEAVTEYKKRPDIDIEYILDGKYRYSDRDYLLLIRQGIKKSTLKVVSKHLGITMESMSDLLHISHRNLQRKDENDILDPLKSEKVVALAAFGGRGVEVLGSDNAFKTWLQSPLMVLGQKMPIEFLDTSFGIQLLTDILGRIEHGVYS